MTSTPPPTDAQKSEKTPRTAKGRRTHRNLLDAAALEFGANGFHEASITRITARAGTALGTFYTYFHSKDEIFRAVVTDISDRVRQIPREIMVEEVSGINAEQIAFARFLEFVREHKEIHRIIDEAEFVAQDVFRQHYESGAARILQRLREGAARGEFRSDLEEAHVWAIMGMNVFLSLRYCVWSDDRSVDEIAAIASSILRLGVCGSSSQK